MLYGIAPRFYPFTKGLVLGGDLGTGLTMLSGLLTGLSNFGLNYGLLVGYDFTKSTSDMGVILGTKVGGYDLVGNDFEDVGMTSFTTIFLNFVGKTETEYIEL